MTSPTSPKRRRRRRRDLLRCPHNVAIGTGMGLSPYRPRARPGVVGSRRGNPTEVQRPHPRQLPTLTPTGQPDQPGQVAGTRTSAPVPARRRAWGGPAAGAVRPGATIKGRRQWDGWLTWSCSCSPSPPRSTTSHPTADSLSRASPVCPVRETRGAWSPRAGHRTPDTWGAASPRGSAGRPGLSKGRGARSFSRCNRTSPRVRRVSRTGLGHGGPPNRASTQVT
jgi:hypothetical protein